MGFVNEYTNIILNSRNIKYYRDLGYDIKTYTDSKGRDSVKRGTIISVKTAHIQKGSTQKVDIYCDNCKKEYKIAYKDYIKRRRDEGYFCKKCAMRLFNSRENNPNWRNDLTDYDRENDFNRRYDVKNSNWILEIFTRDDYTCRKCNKKGVKINAHHLDGWNWCKEKRYEISNGVTLCENCHNNFHSIYGKGNNTKEQYYEWFNNVIPQETGKLPIARKVYCIEEDKIYESVKDLSSEWKCDPSPIYKICNHDKRTKSVKGKHLVWADEWFSKNNKGFYYHKKMK